MTNEEQLKREDYGARFNAGKLEWTLVDFDAFTPMVQVLMFGAKKYTRIFDTKLEKEWNVKVATAYAPLKLEDYATAAMSGTALVRILSLEKRKSSTSRLTNSEIEEVFWSTISDGVENAKQILRTRLIGETGTIFENMESRLRNSTGENKNLAQFVVNQKPLCTQTIVIQLDDFEVCFAVSAITGWDSSMTTLNCLERLLGTSLPFKEYTYPGTHNWKKGFRYTDIMNSMMRHIQAFLAGEDNDPESGLPHIGHIQCNAMFLGYMVQFRKDMDDRYQDIPKAETLFDIEIEHDEKERQLKFRVGPYPRKDKD